VNRLEIEWRHLDKDGKTCDRCSDTGDSVRSAYQTLIRELQPKGWQVTLKETLLTDEEITESNSVYLNGIAIEKLLPGTYKSENCCSSCGEILGAPTMCRTLERNGQTFEAIPAAMILEAARRVVEAQNKQRSAQMEIKVLGPGCSKCHQTEKVVKEAVAETGVSADIEKVTDVMKIAGYGVFGTPAVVVDGEVKSVGKIPSKEDVKAWIIK
jgi:small redox-active disulfide protein 2